MSDQTLKRCYMDNKGRLYKALVPAGPMDCLRVSVLDTALEALPDDPKAAISLEELAARLAINARAVSIERGV